MHHEDPGDPAQPTVPARSSGASEWSGASVPVAARRDDAVAVGTSTAIYHEDYQSLIMLNEGASAIWYCCDGASTVDQIVDSLAQEHAARSAELRQDVHRTLERLAELGLIFQFCETARQ